MFSCAHALCVTLFFNQCHLACGILVPRPGIEPGPSAVKTWSPNHWTTREFPLFLSFTLSFSISFLFLSHVKIQGDAYKPENDLSPQSQNTCILILDFQPLKLCKINICCVTLPIYDILLKQRKLTTTHNNTNVTCLHTKVGPRLCSTLYFYPNCASGRWNKLSPPQYGG